jgi:hypothetical protein
VKAGHGPLDSGQLWGVFSVALVVLLLLLLLSVAAVR